MATKPFSKAAKFFRQRHYEQVIRLLEPQVFRFRESFNFYYLLGFSCLHMGDFGSAYTYLKRGHDIKPTDIETLLGLASVHLKRQETAKAIELWLEVLDSDRKNQYALRGLRLLKKNSDPEFIIDYTESGKLERLIPQPARTFPLYRLLLAILLAGVVAVLLLVAPFSPLRITKSVSETYLPALDIGDIPKLTEVEKSNHPFSFSEMEIQELFESMGRYFRAGRDNMVRREINRILLSNASEPVREKARFLIASLKAPSFSNFKDNFAYREVIKEPALYAGCHVAWKGAVSNLQIGEHAIQFDLLVGYETGRVLEGQVPVTLPFSVRIDPELPIEVLGSVALTGNQDIPFSLTALSVHQFLKEQQ
ncbi:tetratricopeptide repeat protein [Sediminispirochaeta smaragdinae]|jgi:tetratricopeptide (TPR) repeat protein|uniref:TPR repeat-containing protein n=1 Tax=Sediminispirochaeta smaragdinae (strain DSM 11293 / JCM 15392 / SEBR 4228) TaxID=573413 RepID=E1R2Y5_SEDSS|nr:tetratricopeptide repeat protein [Sediminispirochaeta smaragdinae]ADK81171.1 TPR repeat-containing protein [Sediminispirochaeta smaragdinae DSM 11293]